MRAGGTIQEGPCHPGGLLHTVNMPGVKGGAGDREASTRWCLLRNLRPHRLRFYALTYPFGFSTNFVAEPASNSA